MDASTECRVSPSPHPALGHGASQSWSHRRGMPGSTSGWCLPVRAISVTRGIDTSELIRVVAEMFARQWA